MLLRDNRFKVNSTIHDSEEEVTYENLKSSIAITEITTGKACLRCSAVCFIPYLIFNAGGPLLTKMNSFYRHRQQKQGSYSDQRVNTFNWDWLDLHHPHHPLGPSCLKHPHKPTKSVCWLILWETLSHPNTVTAVHSPPSAVPAQKPLLHSLYCSSPHSTNLVLSFIVTKISHPWLAI